ncbi:hypothetical protein [Caulobacter soli]|uniref:hypothetical protein n=1 Tax=Caulobacter soli TaxID=2708539 RepID=UPI0013EDEADA|nr:hypothetical protein [Caulobacter soli]
MFVGHYAAALAAKAVQPKAPFWTYVLGAQLVDVAWAGLVLAGVERISLDPHLPGSPLVLSYIPYTHSLPAVAVWALAAGLAAYFLLKLPRVAAVAIGLVVLSHWGLDFLVHRADLPLWFGGPKVGLGWWNAPVPEQALEMGLLAMAAAAWGWRRGLQGHSGWSAPLFVVLLVTVQLASILAPPTGGPSQMVIASLSAYLLATLFAWLMDQTERRGR